MHTAIQLAVVTVAFVQTSSGYSSYLKKIPNGESLGRLLGHTDSGYTDFGKLFSEEGADWMKVCQETWPGGSVTCGEALGDPCCTWTSGEPDHKLSEVNLEGTTCESKESTPAAEETTPAAEETTHTTEEATSAAVEKTLDDATETDTVEQTSTTPADEVEESAVQSGGNATETAAVTDSSEYCE
ncbi:hypothetical protein PsorP6_017934 [Peronosclerospora sorghi]|uniref:Uncharacterized protein n=1 Tax=Peronosclerospora sorghi TaxID=230839 RepID=A0ACC0WE79_9STRA|nr:hypothetical protein PsorP6_017934 [Peronosclerospora sorghi]